MLALASTTGQYSLALARHACDDDAARLAAARALKRPWAPVVFHGERETSESLPEIDARFTPDGDADEAAGFRAVEDFNEMEPIPALGKAYVPGSSHRARALARRAATDEPLRFAVFGNSFTIGSNCGESTTQHLGQGVSLNVARTYYARMRANSLRRDHRLGLAWRKTLAMLGSELRALLCLCVPTREG